MIENDKIDNFKKNVEQIKFLLNEEIELIKSGHSNKNVEQIKTILYDVENMDIIRNSKLYRPVFDKIIIDSWDYSDGLGIKLLRLFKVYYEYFTK